MKSKTGIIIALLLSTFLIISCGQQKAPGDQNTEIINGAEAMKLLKLDNAVLVDAQNSVSYNKQHIKNSVNISRADITVNEPFPNMLAPEETFAKAVGDKGIDNNTLAIIYDSNKNMDSARLWWTFKIYGHDNVKVVSGGLDELVRAGAETTTEIHSVTSKEFKINEYRAEMIVTRDDVKNQLNNPDPETVIIDTRTKEEYEDGTIPGSIHLDFEGNNFTDNTYKPVQQLRIRYLEEKIDYDKEIIMYCKTSIRGAQTYLALYNAGYRDLKLYDGAWVEWSANPLNPVFKPEKPVYMINSSDNS